MAALVVHYSNTTCPGCFFDLFPNGLVDDLDVFLFSEDFGRLDPSGPI